VAVPSLDATAAEESMQVEAPERYRIAYTQWRQRLRRHDLFVGRHLLADASAAGALSSASRAELQRSIARMQTRWSRWLRTTEEGRGFLFERKVRRRVPGWGRAQLRSIAACESQNDPRAVGGGGAYRGLYQFSFSTWRAVGRRRLARGAGLASLAAAEPPRLGPLAHVWLRGCFLRRA
jgi:hypothetical protein